MPPLPLHKLAWDTSIKFGWCQKEGAIAAPRDVTFWLSILLKLQRWCVAPQSRLSRQLYGVTQMDRDKHTIA